MADHHRWFDKRVFTLKGVYVGTADADGLYFYDYLIGGGDCRFGFVDETHFSSSRNFYCFHIVSTV